MFADAALERELRAGLVAVEEQLRQSVKSSYPFVTETSLHLLEAGGKRVRPMLALLTAQLGDADAPGVVPSAVVVEITHLASLYHDDVMDEAQMRRGVPSARRVLGQLRRDPHRRPAVRARERTSSPTSVRARPHLQADTFERLVPRAVARDRSVRARTTTRSSTTCRCWPTRPAR